MNQELCHQLFDYQDGCLSWKVGKGTAKAGDKAHSNGNEYRAIKVNQKVYLEHKLVWLWHNGEIPKELDHIDGNPANNRIENLRLATHSENMRNTRIRVDNQSGVKGVHWCKTKNKWKVQLRFNGKQKYLGRYDSLDVAQQVIEQARLNHHNNFSNTGV